MDGRTGEEQVRPSLLFPLLSAYRPLLLLSPTCPLSSTLLDALGPLPLSSDPSARFTDAPTCPVVERSSRVTSPFEEFYALVLMSIGRRVRRMLSPARLSNTVNGTDHVNLRGDYNL
ncbi:hypothetical protein FA13DRAFT_1397589 [Coprinellus micaceus]|uniref:Uncharacterized protein n=1 Tax=Coprinellus micaceus TaxID=71717 RepID=A0A4Y7SQ85_COPMI|nr:hypothetical protein FA13DRAFT_1397589 [Coprinellus micaceus]